MVLFICAQPLDHAQPRGAAVGGERDEPVSYTHLHVDCGDFVIVINADKAVLTGKKLTQKYYRHHTGWVGGLKEVQYKTLMAEKPEFAMQLAVKGMLPKNSIGRQSATRLKVYAGENHNHQAQKPENWEK